MVNIRIGFIHRCILILTVLAMGATFTGVFNFYLDGEPVSRMHVTFMTGLVGLGILASVIIFEKIIDKILSLY